MITMNDLEQDLATLTVRGPVFRPGDRGYGEGGYDDELAGFQTGVATRPAVVVGALDADDVAAAVALAARHGLPIGVQATGHGRVIGLDGGVLVSTRRMDTVTVDPAAATARVGAGVRAGALLDAAGPHGLMPVSGSSPEVGVIGYTLAGGYGLLSRAFGFAADHVRAIEVVTADAHVVRVDEENDADLFWALRGARDDLGIVTALEIDLMRVEHLIGGGLWFDVADAPAVLDTFTAVAADAPDGLSVSLGALALPDAPGVPEPLRGRRVVHVRVASVAGPAVTDAAVARLRAAGTVLTGGVAELSPERSGEIVGDPTWAHAYEGTNVLVTDLDRETLARVLDAAGPSTVVDVRPLGGAMARAPRRPSAVGFREAGAIVRLVSVTGPDGADDEVHARHARVAAVLAERVVGRAVGFVYGRRAPGEETSAVRGEATHAAVHRVVERRDPDGVFGTTATRATASSSPGTPAGRVAHRAVRVADAGEPDVSVFTDL